MPEKRYLQAQIKAIEIAKWAKGIELGCDPGEGFVQEWVDKFAKDFRDRWPYSLCRLCTKTCAHECKAFCIRFTKYGVTDVNNFSSQDNGL